MLTTLREIKAALPLLNEAEFARLVRGVMGIRTVQRANALTILDQVQLGLWEWLVHLGFVSDAQRQLLHEMTKPAFEEYARLVGECFVDGKLNKTSMPVFALQIADQRFAGWTGHGYWVDLDFREESEELEAPPVTRIVCDLSAMYCRLYDRLVELRSRTDAARREPAQPIPDDVPGDNAT